MCEDAVQVAHAVAVAIAKRARINLVKHRLLPPKNLCFGHILHENNYSLKNADHDQPHNKRPTVASKSQLTASYLQEVYNIHFLGVQQFERANGQPAQFRVK